MSNIFKNILLAIIFALSNSLIALNSEGLSLFATYILEVAALGNPNFTPEKLIQVCINLLPIFVGEIIFGLQLYKRFCTASVYFFCRQEKKYLWYFRETLHLFGMISLYIGTYLGCIFIIGLLRWNYDHGILLLLFYTWFYLTCYLYIFAIILNVISILIGNNISFIIVYTMQLILLFSLTIYEKEIPSNGIRLLLFKINPICNIIVRWHSSQELFPQLLNSLPIQFELNDSILYFVCITGIVVILAGIVMCKVDISLEDKEENF